MYSPPLHGVLCVLCCARYPCIISQSPESRRMGNAISRMWSQGCIPNNIPFTFFRLSSTDIFPFMSSTNLSSAIWHARWKKYSTMSKNRGFSAVGTSLSLSGRSWRLLVWRTAGVQVFSSFPNSQGEARTHLDTDLRWNIARGRWIDHREDPGVRGLATRLEDLTGGIGSHDWTKVRTAWANAPPPRSRGRSLISSGAARTRRAFSRSKPSATAGTRCLINNTTSYSLKVMASLRYWRYYWGHFPSLSKKNGTLI